jgi:hypothetical protein
MSAKRLGISALLSVVAIVLASATMAGAASNPTVLHFRVGGAGEHAIGVNLNAGSPPVGSEVAIIGALYNTTAQFGKPSGAAVGRILLDCTVLVSSPADGLCLGILHVPNGFLTFGGNGPFTTYSVDHYGVTGGDGPYAFARGELTVVRHAEGGLLTVTLSSAP